MSDNYQAVYEAVRSRFHMPDIDGIMRSAFDISFAVDMVRASYQEAACEQMRPCVIFSPKVYPDGDMWCALYGDNLQEGVVGFGKTPSAAMYDFDKNWSSQELTTKNLPQLATV